MDNSWSKIFQNISYNWFLRKFHKKVRWIAKPCKNHYSSIKSVKSVLRWLYTNFLIPTISGKHHSMRLEMETFWPEKSRQNRLDEFWPEVAILTAFWKFNLRAAVTSSFAYFLLLHPTFWFIVFCFSAFSNCYYYYYIATVR